MALYLGTNKVGIIGPNDGFLINGKLLVKKDYTINLGQTNYSELTISTTSQNLTLPATTYTTTPSTTITCRRIGANYDGTIVDFNTFDYVGFVECVIEYNYGTNDVSSVIHGIRSSYARDFQEGKYRQGVNSSTGQLTTTISKNSSYITGITPILYQKADSTYGMTTAQGIYHNGTSNITWSTSSNYIDLKLGTICVKANDSYCPVSSLELINPAATTVKMTWYIYEGNKSMYGNIYTRGYELAANE